MSERKLLRQLREIAEAGERAAFCTVIETVGSTPQKAGAHLVIRPNGTSFGTLGGGCVEAEARKQAMRLMHEGRPRLLSFRLDGDYGWDDGLICGGSMRIFVDMTDRPEDRPLFRALDERIAQDVPLVLAVVVDGPEPLIGQKALLGADGTRLGSLGEERARSGAAAPRRPGRLGPSSDRLGHRRRNPGLSGGRTSSGKGDHLWRRTRRKGRQRTGRFL
ncbi:MAG: hypothetical protein KatS3mg115_0099 [Candidatus Poribacteria bacterium]|nr:MAG: hypothetical protein KatS3mg115_0099 [Candidatus Poribacteria bacterium]